MEPAGRRKRWLPVLLGIGLIFLLVISVFSGKDLYIRLLPEARVLAAFPEPPGLIAGTERLYAGKTNSRGWSSREYRRRRNAGGAG